MTYRAENPRVNEVLASWNRTGDYEYLQSYFVERVLEIVSRLGNKAAIGKGFNPMFFLQKFPMHIGFQCGKRCSTMGTKSMTTPWFKFGRVGVEAGGPS